MPVNIDLHVTSATNDVPGTVAVEAKYFQTIRRYRALTDRELVDTLLRFANTCAELPRTLLEHGALPLSSVVRLRLKEEKEPIYNQAWRLAETDASETGPEQLRTWQRQLRQPEWGALREALDKIVSGQVTEPLLSSWRRRAAGVVLIPSFEPDGTRAYRYAPFEVFKSGIQPSVAYALMLLQLEPFRGRLCRCKWSECTEFFLQPVGRRGAPVRDYCPGTDHRDRVHQANAVERMRRSRERAKARARNKRKRR